MLSLFNSVKVFGCLKLFLARPTRRTKKETDDKLVPAVWRRKMKFSKEKLVQIIAEETASVLREFDLDAFGAETGAGESEIERALKGGESINENKTKKKSRSNKK